MERHNLVDHWQPESEQRQLKVSGLDEQVPEPPAVDRLDLAAALGAALYSLGLPTDSVIQYETAVKAESFLVMAHGSAADMARAEAHLDRLGISALR